MDFNNCRWLSIAGLVLAGVGTLLQAMAQHAETEEIIEKKVKEELDKRLEEED